MLIISSIPFIKFYFFFSLGISFLLQKQNTLQIYYKHIVSTIQNNLNYNVQI